MKSKKKLVESLEEENAKNLKLFEETNKKIIEEKEKKIVFADLNTLQ